MLAGRRSRTMKPRASFRWSPSAVSRPSTTKPAPRKVIPYTDAGWKEFADHETKRIVQMEAERRQQAFQQHAGTWEKRRELAKQWLAATPEIPVPDLPPGFPAFNAIDHFLAARI